MVWRGRRAANIAGRREDCRDKLDCNSTDLRAPPGKPCRPKCWCAKMCSSPTAGELRSYVAAAAAGPSAAALSPG